MKPSRSILDKAFRYTPAVNTDVRATFERIRKEREKEAEREREDAKEREQKLVSMRKR